MLVVLLPSLVAAFPDAVVVFVVGFVGTVVFRTGPPIEVVFVFGPLAEVVFEVGSVVLWFDTVEMFCFVPVVDALVVVVVSFEESKEFIRDCFSRLSKVRASVVSSIKESHPNEAFLTVRPFKANERSPVLFMTDWTPSRLRFEVSTIGITMIQMMTTTMAPTMPKTRRQRAVGGESFGGCLSSTTKSNRSLLNTFKATYAEFALFGATRGLASICG